MAEKKIPRFSVEPVPDCHPVIGYRLAMLDDARSRLDFALREVRDMDLDRTPPVGVNTIGTILYHIAITDLVWVYENMLQKPYPDDIAELFPHPIRNEDDLLYPLRGWTLEDYRKRLEAARAKVHEVFLPMTVEDLREIILREEPSRIYEMTPEAVLYHLAQHESEHRGEIQLFISAFHEQGK